MCVMIITLRPRQNGCYFVDSILKFIFFNENCSLLFQISLIYVHKGLIEDEPALIQIMTGAEQVTIHYLNQSS